MQSFARNPIRDGGLHPPYGRAGGPLRLNDVHHAENWAIPTLPGWGGSGRGLSVSSLTYGFSLACGGVPASLARG